MLERLKIRIIDSSRLQIEKYKEKPWFIQHFLRLRHFELTDDTKLANNMFTEFVSLNTELEELSFTTCPNLVAITQPIVNYYKDLRIRDIGLHLESL